MDIEKIISRMTLKEKICQLTQIPFSTNDLEKTKERLKNECIGSLILAVDATAGNSPQDSINADVINELQKIAMDAHGIPLVFGRDVIHGHHICLPVPLAMAASFNPQLVEKGYSFVAKDAKNDGINWSFAPMLDLSRDPRWGRIIESPGEDPLLGKKMAEAVVKGFQGDGDTINVAACAKHYIGYGAATGGRDYYHAEISDYSMRNYYLPAFDAAVKSGCATVMNSFNEVGGQPTCSSKYLLTDVLRGELGFDGFVISDWEAIKFLCQQGVAKNNKEAASLALNAGIDMDMVDNCFYDTLEASIKDNQVALETIDEAVRRVLRIKARMGLFDNPYIQKKELNLDEYRYIAKELAAESMVMLKNNGALPLNTYDNVCVTGYATFDKRSMLGSWTIDGDINESVCVYDGIKNISNNASYYDFNDRMDMNLKYYDAIVIVLDQSYKITGETNAVASLELTDSQKEMISIARKMNKRVIGILNIARPMALETVIDSFDALIYAWHSGSQAGNAVAEILYGKRSPSGRLPVTMPRVTGQVPIFYNCPPQGKYNAQGYYSEPTIPNCYNDCAGTPLYPFGYGLTYTEFDYHDVSCENTKISLDDIISGKKFKLEIVIENIGDFEAKETVQCYVRDCIASMTRPIKELKAFAKDSYNPGEKKNITFELGYEDLGFYGADGKYTVEKGEFLVYIGKDSYCDNYITIEII